MTENTNNIKNIENLFDSENSEPELNITYILKQIELVQNQTDYLKDAISGLSEMPPAGSGKSRGFWKNRQQQGSDKSAAS